MWRILKEKNIITKITDFETKMCMDTCGDGIDGGTAGSAIVTTSASGFLERAGS